MKIFTRHLIAYLFCLLPTAAFAQSSSTFSGSYTASDGTTINYTAQLGYQLGTTGTYSERPQRIRMSLRSLTITDVIQNGERAGRWVPELLPRNISVSSSSSYNIKGSYAVMDRNYRVGGSFRATGIGMGGSYLDSYPFTESEKEELKNRFGDNNSVNVLSVSLTNLEITSGLRYAAQPVIDAMKKKIRDEAQAKRDEEKRLKDEQDREREREEAETEEQARNQAGRTDSNENNGQKTDEENIDDAAEREGEKAAEREREAEQRKREREAEYRQRKQSQQNANNALAASTAASSAGILFIVGGFIYDNMGRPAKNFYSGDNLFINFDFGYGVSGFPIANNSVSKETGEVNNEPSTALTIDLRLSTRFGYETENWGANVMAQFEPGFSPVFTSFNYSFNYGAEAFGGLDWVKAYASYRRGSRNYSISNWIDVDEIGEGSKSSTTYQQLRAGLKFSYYRNNRTAMRDHISFGIIEDYFQEDAATIFSIREDPGSPVLNLLGTPETNFIDGNPFVASGFFFEWKRDHTHRLYLDFYPDYPITGEVGGDSNKGRTFIQAGFIRTIESFLPKNK